MLGICFVNGADINAEMVRRGFAWAFIKYSTSYARVEARGESSEKWACGRATPSRRGNSGTAAGPSVENDAPSGCAIKGNVTKNGRIYHMPWSPWYGQIRIETGQGQALVLLGGRGNGRRMAARSSKLAARGSVCGPTATHRAALLQHPRTC